MKKWTVFLLLWWPVFTRLSGAAQPVPLPEAWRYVQTFEAVGTGLVKISIPMPTLGALRPGLQDLRLFDADGKEVPFVIEQPFQSSNTVFKAVHFEVKIRDRSTVISFDTGQTLPLEEMILETPASQFLKAATVSASRDGLTWQPLSADDLLFRYPNGAAKLGLLFVQSLPRIQRLPHGRQPDESGAGIGGIG